jgi:predicted RND superfamily exporter protein
LVDSLQTSTDIYKSLVDPPLGLSPANARARLEGSFLGKDGTAALFVRFNSDGIALQKQAIELVRSAADGIEGLGREPLQMVGSIYEGYAVDEAAEKSLKRLVLPSSLMGVVLAWLCLRSVRGALTVLLIGGLGQLIAVAVVALTGGEFSAVLIVLPTLVFMLTLSAAVHFMNYYGDVAYSHRDHLGARAILLGLKPSILATLTTSLGMIALATSQLSPVRTFGLLGKLFVPCDCRTIPCFPQAVGLAVQNEVSSSSRSK